MATPGAIWYAGKTKDLLLAKPPITTTIETIDRKGQKTTKPMWKMSPAQTIEAPRIECMIRSGERFYLGTEGRVAIYEKNREIGQIRLEGTPATLLAADDRLFVVTREGKIACYGQDQRAPQSHAWGPRPDLGKGPSPMADTMASEGVAEGYGLIYSAAGARTLLPEVGRTRSHLIFIHPDLQAVEEMRSRLSASGVYGELAEVHPGTVDTVEVPPYLAQAVFFDAPELSASRLRRLFGSLRPFGGKLFLPKSLHAKGEIDRAILEAGLQGSLLTETDREWVVERSGPLAGSANWTHEHADAANTRVSKDQVVRAPLGLLWFGGPSNEGILPRHGHGPQPQVIDGRLILEGVDKLRATDIYTGRLLWEASLPGVGDFYNNVVHQAGANATGTNFISTSDGIYVAWRAKCVRLDPATGKILSEFTLPGASAAWGYLNVVGDVLLGGADPLMDVKVERKVEGGFDDPLANPGSLITRILSFKGDNDTLSASRRLVAMDRRTGKVLWEAQARAAFRHNAICAGGGRLYAIDRLSGPQVDRLKKKNEVPKIVPRMVAFDLRDGKELWQSEEDVFGTWLSYSEGRDILVEAGRVARDTLVDEAKGMRARRGSDGSELWKKAYLGPAMIHGDTILMSDRACDLGTGQATARLHPITQQAVEWSWARTYGCNTPSASEHLLTFRSGAA
ncbi:MAG TPA: PQQ-binding-like beta-propeller repeat protein, partial [Planctomycetota bacterium]|nr:PQQ-binding-like beta-propeller repeat protein [Planctomycetota bacterium]